MTDRTYIVEDGDDSDEDLGIVAITSVDFEWDTNEEVEIVVPLNKA